MTLKLRDFEPTSINLKSTPMSVKLSNPFTLHEHMSYSFLNYHSCYINCPPHSRS